MWAAEPPSEPGHSSSKGRRTLPGANPGISITPIVLAQAGSSEADIRAGIPVASSDPTPEMLPFQAPSWLEPVAQHQQPQADLGLGRPVTRERRGRWQFRLWPLALSHWCPGVTQDGPSGEEASRERCDPCSHGRFLTFCVYPAASVWPPRLSHTLPSWGNPIIH